MNLMVGDSDTIVAIATGSGAGGVGIIRLSGPDAFTIARKMTATDAKARQAHFVSIVDGQNAVLDQGLLLQFPGPHSFTGEDVAELHCHGGPVLLRTVLRECIYHGARQATPGEFSQRAFLNNKIDLVQAEAIADLISSSTEAAARSASRSLTGSFSVQVDALLEQLIRLRVFIEAAIDFPEEEIDFIAESDVLERLETLASSINALLKSARRGRTLRDGLKLVIAGAPNAGKSSLLNQLAEQDSAIVTDIPGTTRDLLREHIQIDGLPLHIVDTAGLRDSGDAIEQEGIRRARSEMQSADHILLVVDNSGESALLDAATLVSHYEGDLPEAVPITLIRNKCDIQNIPATFTTGDINEICLSALRGDGIDLLRRHLLTTAGIADTESSDFSARERHVLALEECAGHLAQGLLQLKDHGAAELIAEDLRYAQDSLGSITGSFSSDELLGEIFGSFCIGK
ncbi:tRNA uridine-5-carboxymethylaminomethyl(34) synthesis GTPase MnmE [Congregibacter litoralis]|uniref:tRNA modification GTPase MnmE n=1 Tax=Congregibacter litoralis KT71 TaxID=314285 RepID=A4A961_9GAMM|nr:tRNA uridine-5-carboxymethylaminomethyl(34) synthesis GTPase MnmE [Congregibacter litoralis]EAQ97603.1 tRNA modification GTPase trmE [Congregibacter litoralis KT71]